jgi:hypothetical protein
MAIGLFVQIGLIAHLYHLLAGPLGVQAAGVAMGLATAAAIVGRAIAARALLAGADRRLAACAALAVQLAGVLALAAAGPQQTGWMLVGILLFGSGIGNATSLPPLIAQVEFAKDDVPRVIALIVGMAQAAYAFAPAVCGVMLTTLAATTRSSAAEPAHSLSLPSRCKVSPSAASSPGRRRQGP